MPDLLHQGVTVMKIQVKQVSVGGFEMYKAIVTTDMGAPVHVTGGSWSAAQARCVALRWIALYGLVSLVG